MCTRFGLALLLSAIAVNWLSATQFPVVPESGSWLILIQSYAGEGSGPLADEFCECLRRDYRLNAFVLNRGEEERRKERERVAQIHRKNREIAKAQGIPDDAPLPKVKTYRIEDNYGVVIGGWKDMATARKALDEVRKLKPPAQKFMHQGVVAAPSQEKARDVVYGGLNPFQTAFVVRNPLVPLPPDPEKGKLENLKEYNADESFSLLKCKKPYTLMVKSYQGAVSLASARSEHSTFIEKLGGNKPGQLLNASARQAHQMAEILKQLRDDKKQLVINTDIYVLHTESASYVCVGGFDRPDDPALKQYQQRLAKIKLALSAKDADTFNPMPMPVPKP